MNVGPYKQLVSFPDAVKIGESAFCNCRVLTTVNFGQARTIGDWAFENCRSLRMTSFPNVQNIEESKKIQ